MLKTFIKVKQTIKKMQDKFNANNCWDSMKQTCQ